ncbi:MAG TPA: hypothetical protein VFY03_12380 [Woeseiaceae bacterium]|nr:hypothetical protein [Woeseiaceae bacterium]
MPATAPGRVHGRPEWKRIAMFDRLKKWLGFEEDDEDVPPARASALNRSGAFARPATPGRAPQRPVLPRPAPQGSSSVTAPGTARPEAVRPEAVRPEASEAETDAMQADAGSEIADLGPGKNVLVRNKFRREDTGTHETLTIVDDSAVQTGEETGIDPYNTGKFDRSRNWDKRFR